MSTPALGAQQQDWNTAKAKPESVTVVPNKRYAAGKLYRWLFGDNYRDLWTTPIRVPVFDWHTFQGGLHPIKEGGGNQTKSLRFAAANGAEYVFRTADKSVKSAPEELKATPVAPLLQDEVSALHPAGAEVAAPIVAATGVLHPTPKLVVMPDDSALGKYRHDFGGRLGMVEEYPNVPDEGVGFAGATKIIDSEDLLKLLNADPAEHIDARTFLVARMTDFLLNDNDRHGGNWKWARLDSEPKNQWAPIARDRDHALVSYGGALIAIVRPAKPSLLEFGTTIDVPGLTQPSGFDARLLAGLEKPVWDSIVKVVQTKVSDSVIDAATRAMPAAYQQSAPGLAKLLKERRAALPKAANEYYHDLARYAPVHATDGPDRAVITRRDDGTVEVKLEAKGKQYFSRRFDSRETSELLVYLHGGADTAIVSGNASRSILVRVIGGNGTNTFIDSSTVAGHRNPTRFYDEGTVTGISYGPDTTFDRRPWERLKDTLVPHLPDDGSSFAPVVGLSEHRGMGLTPRLGITKYSYGFGQRPYASMMSVEGEYASEFHAGRVAVTLDHRFEASPLHLMTVARMSDFDIVRFSGFGNATENDGRADEYFQVRARQWLVNPAVAFAFGPNLDLSFGPEITRTTTDSLANHYLSTARPYGFGTINQAGVRLAARYTRRDAPDDDIDEHTHHRLLIEASARYVPALMDLQSSFEETGVAMGIASPLPLPSHPLLVVRSGAKKVFGDFPFYEAATIGGEGTTRYMDTQRYAGDASLYATSELRVPLARFKLIVPLRTGILGLAEAGRVYVDGSSPGGWHSRTGGGVWLGRGNASPVITLTRTTEPGRAGVHLRFGLNF